MTEGEIHDDWPLKPGASIEDRFTLLQQLRKGSHGAVYVAESRFSGKRVALKVLFNSAKDYAERMRAEARALGAINHPNVVPIDDGGVTTSLSPVTGLLWFAMPLQEGPTLRDELDRAGALPIERAARFLEQIARGCEAAHAVGIIHRDLKPENIIVVSATDSIVILDFGVSKLSERLRTGSGLKTTDRHRILGTSEYNAPERLLEGATDARSDIYSGGVVAYEMFAGRHCFSIGPGPRDFPNAIDLGTMLLFEQPKPVQELRPDIPDRLAALVNQMLEKDPARRPQSMREVADRAGEQSPSTSAAIDAHDVPARIAAQTASNAPVIRSRTETTTPPAPAAPATRSFRSSGPVEIRSSEASLSIDAALVCGAARFAARSSELTDVERGMRVLAAHELRDSKFHGLLASYAANTCHATESLRARVRKAFALVGTGTPQDASSQLERLRADANRGGWTPESSPKERQSSEELLRGAGLLIPPEICSEAAENALARMADLDELTRDFAHSILVAFARVPLERHEEARGPLVALALGTAEDSELARSGLARFLLTAAQVRDQTADDSDDTQPDLASPVAEDADTAQPETVSRIERSVPGRTGITPTPASMITPAKPSPAPAELEPSAPRVNALAAFAVTMCVALVIVGAALVLRRAGSPAAGTNGAEPEHAVAPEGASVVPGMPTPTSASDDAGKDAASSPAIVNSPREVPAPVATAPALSQEPRARPAASESLGPIYGAPPRPSSKPTPGKPQPLPGSGL